jgi:hypothetical protein
MTLGNKPGVSFVKVAIIESCRFSQMAGAIRTAQLRWQLHIQHVHASVQRML